MKSHYFGELSWCSIEILIFITEIQSGKHLGNLLSKHNIRHIRRSQGKVVQLRDGMSSVLEIQLKYCTSFFYVRKGSTLHVCVFLWRSHMKSWNFRLLLVLSLKKLTGQNGKRIICAQKYRQTLHESSRSVQFTVSAVSKTLLFTVSGLSMSFRQLPILRQHWLYSPYLLFHCDFTFFPL